MGLPIEKEVFLPAEYDNFDIKLNKNIRALGHMLENTGFGSGPTSLGAEVEFYIINGDGKIECKNQDILNQGIMNAASHVEQIQLELNQYNIEYNLSPVEAIGRPFSAMASELQKAITSINNDASALNSRIIPIGILPTLESDNLSAENMTDLKRYHVLAKRLKELRGSPFQVNIHGEEFFSLLTNDITLEGANTSLQIHMRVSPDEFVDVFNATQIITPLLVALSCNSPFLLGTALWDETRIALFKQSIDSRTEESMRWHPPSRVSFGTGWLRRSPLEAFQESVALFPVILPISSMEDPFDVIKNGGYPQLQELKLHQGTTWPWNRAVYDHKPDGHLRIEMRSLPAGPTTLDMMANTAFYVGLAHGLKRSVNSLLSALPFQHAEKNFYRSAKHGLDAKVIWPDEKQHRLTEMPILSIIESLFPLAEAGLTELNVEEKEISTYLSIIKERLQTKQNGAKWQRVVTQKYQNQGCERNEALQNMTKQYAMNFEKGLPVARWDTSI